jgi:N-acetylglucosamine-6-phosphate deacetylase
MSLNEIMVEGTLSEGGMLAFVQKPNLAGRSGASLASAIVGLDHMVRHMKKHTKATLPEAIRMASLTPAERTGIAKDCGSLEVGKRADVLLLNRKLEVRATMIA